MPYCRNCGEKIEDDARFCQKCGTPVGSYPSAPPTPVTPAKPAVPLRKDPLVIGAIVLIAIVLTAAIVVAFLAAPFNTWEMSRSLEDSAANVKTLFLNFETNIGSVDVTPLKVANNNIGIYVQANGSQSVIGGGEVPVSISFDNQTVGNVLTINSRVNVEERYSMRANVRIQVFVDPALDANLNVTSQAGQVSLTGDKNLTLQSLNLQTSAGTVQANLQNVTVTGNISLATSAGTVHYRMNEVKVLGNETISLKSNAGSVNVDITQTKTMQGNLQVNAQTNLGSVNVGVVVDGDVAAKLISHTSLGSINVARANNFSGNQSPIQSNNYPAAGNIEIDSSTNLGSISIDADYRSQQEANVVRN